MLGHLNIQQGPCAQARRRDPPTYMYRMRCNLQNQGLGFSVLGKVIDKPFFFKLFLKLGALAITGYGNQRVERGRYQVRTHITLIHTSDR